MDRSLAMVLVLGCLTGAAVSIGCDRQQGGYDPKLDGVSPRVAYVDSDTTGMPNILKDPRTVRTAGGGSGGGTAVRVTTPTSGKAGGEPEGPILVPETAPPVPVPPDIGG